LLAAKFDYKEGQMAKKNYKIRLPKAKILQFTPTGKSIPVSAQTIADDKQRIADNRLLRARYGDNWPPEDLRGWFLAKIKGGDEGVQKDAQRFL
jgi:hypothetical protein